MQSSRSFVVELLNGVTGNPPAKEPDSSSDFSFCTQHSPRMTFVIHSPILFSCSKGRPIAKGSLCPANGAAVMYPPGCRSSHFSPSWSLALCVGNSASICRPRCSWAGPINWWQNRLGRSYAEMFDPDAGLPQPNRALVYFGACIIAGLRLARERQVNFRVVPTSNAIDESVDLAHEIFNRVFRRVPEKIDGSR